MSPCGWRRTWSLWPPAVGRRFCHFYRWAARPGKLANLRAAALFLSAQSTPEKTRQRPWGTLCPASRTGDKCPFTRSGRDGGDFAPVGSGGAGLVGGASDAGLWGHNPAFPAALIDRVDPFGWGLCRVYIKDVKFRSDKRDEGTGPSRPVPRGDAGTHARNRAFGRRPLARCQTIGESRGSRAADVRSP